MTDFKNGDSYFEINIFVDSGTIFDTEKNGYSVLHDESQNLKKRSTGKTLEECVDDMIQQLIELKKGQKHNE